MTLNYLSGQNLRLRALEPADIQLLFEWENDTTIWQVSNTLTPFSRYQLEEYVLNGNQDLFTVRQLRLMIDRTPGQKIETIGTVDLFDFDPYHLRAGVGIMIQERSRNRGFAREAMQILIRYAFEKLHLHQLFCNISSDNEESKGLFTSLGFSRCGIKKDWINTGKGWDDEWMYQLIDNHE
ncbi:MAG: GNAT family N-acetyltransferase [Bacteroidales bacterium]|nr:GNAT family N-acetyltransferase [Bacteroidales bacterium]